MPKVGVDNKTAKLIKEKKIDMHKAIRAFITKEEPSLVSSL